MKPPVTTSETFTSVIRSMDVEMFTLLARPTGEPSGMRRLTTSLVTTMSSPITVTVKLHQAVLLLLSVAVQITRLAPIGKVEPLGGTHETLATAQLSSAGR